MPHKVKNVCLKSCKQENVINSGELTELVCCFSSLNMILGGISKGRHKMSESVFRFEINN